jgi:hypothetical protein
MESHAVAIDDCTCVATTTGKQKKITIDWGAITLVSVVAFLLGWWLFGLLGAIVLALIVMVLMGIIKYQ